MIISGIIIKGFKTYKGINYIPISNGNNFCGLIGKNGVGKSSILEALDCFFNNKIWNKNIDTNRSDISYIMPIFLLETSELADYKEKEFVTKYSEATKNFISNEISATTNNVKRKQLWEEVKKQHSTINTNDLYVVPLCLDENRSIDLGIVGDDILNAIEMPESIPEGSYDSPQNRAEEEKNKTNRNNRIKDNLAHLYTYLIDKTTYVYIPKDIEPARFVVFETEEIQHLIGTDLTNEVKKQLPETTIKKISEGLKNFVDGLSGKLSGYAFKMDGQRQRNLNSKDIYNLIVHDFFSKRELCKIEKGKDLPLAKLSSGEKQQAIISFINSIIKNYRNDNKRLIVAIDEPESALHISMCYEQFEKLYDISKNCSQVIFTSHWYGFIPSITDGCIANIINEGKEENHRAIIFNIYKYREEIKHTNQNLKGQLPIEVTFKGINDLIQSITSSVIKKECYNWLICEGSSDKIYFEHYFNDLMSEHRLRIIPVCGASEVKKIFNHLNLAFEDLKEQIKGKVYLLTDTDAQLLEFDSKSSSNKLVCKRIVNDENKTTKLVEIKSNPKIPTVIEDVLDGMAFFDTLLYFKTLEPELLGFITDDLKPTNNGPSGRTIDLRDSERELIKKFFYKENNKYKVLFAKKYVELLQVGDYKTPSWIKEINDFFIN